MWMNLKEIGNSICKRRKNGVPVVTIAIAWTSSQNTKEHWSIWGNQSKGPRDCQNKKITKSKLIQEGRSDMRSWAFTLKGASFDNRFGMHLQEMKGFKMANITNTGKVYQETKGILRKYEDTDEYQISAKKNNMGPLLSKCQGWTSITFTNSLFTLFWPTTLSCSHLRE